MDSQIVYVKTASGEEAMHQRTRVMQRNVRMVLILVDGKSTVADLVLKTGNQKLTENALRELDKAGFILPVVEQDSLWAEGKKVAQEVRDAAFNKARKLSSSGGKDAPRAVEPSLSETSISLHSAFASSKGASSMSHFSVAPIPPLQFGQPVAGQLSSVFSQQDEKTNAQERPVPSGDSRPGLWERVKVAFLSGKSEGSESLSIKPVRRGQRRRMGWPAWVGSALFVVLAIAVLAVLAFPFDSYLPELEAKFAKATGQRVKVGSMRVDLYPKPGLFLGDVRVGQENSELRISNIVLRPVMGSLFSNNIGFQRAELSGLLLSPESVVGMTEVFAALTNRVTGVAVGSVVFDKAEVSFQGLGFSEMNGEVKVAADGRFESLLLSSADRGLNLELKPQGKTLGVTVVGSGWRPSEKSAFLFTSIDLQARIEKNTMLIDQMELRIFDGVVKGSAVLMGDKQASVSGKASFERISAARLGEALGIGSQLAGEIAGTVGYLSSSETWGGVFPAMLAEGEFTMRRGSVQGIDLAEAVRRVSTSPVEGGKTVFEQLSGRIRVAPTAYQFSGLILDSGLMQATGGVEVSKELRIHGKMELQMRGTVNQMRVPVTITGLLKNPTVQISTNR